MSDPGWGWIDRVVRDRTGEVVGVVVDVYSNARSNAPAWLAISSGFFGARRVVGPVAGSSLVGDDVVLAHERADVDAGPPVTVHVVVGPADEQLLTEHFSVCDRRRQHTTQNSKGITSP